MIREPRNTTLPIELDCFPDSTDKLSAYTCYIRPSSSAQATSQSRAPKAGATKPKQGDKSADRDCPLGVQQPQPQPHPPVFIVPTPIPPYLPQPQPQQQVLPPQPQAVVKPAVVPVLKQPPQGNPVIGNVPEGTYRITRDIVTGQLKMVQQT